MTMQTESPDPLAFREPSYSANASGCAEAANPSTHGAAVRDTQNRAAGHLPFPAPEWAALLNVLRP
ncbi:DUF397 domain-containing protein [Nocardiopsis dassonvillei]|uniref:DUF397 domain-containing protein n=1 Tax=Nocardiopsis dassonvillei TaxID=2014 RepID=UPI003F56DEA9